MNYETIKQLEEAGWPVFHVGTCYTGRPKCYCISLSDLLYACGDKFDYLARDCEEGGFYAYGTRHITDLCATPEGAVARLWLALHEK